MNPTISAVVHECTTGSDDARLTFPDVIAKLIDAGVERYHADLLRGEKTYYLPDGESLVVACRPLDEQPSAGFSAAGIERAVRAVQAKQTNYHQFCAQVAAAGCTDYVVSLIGRRAVYTGRTAESYVEPFPGS